MTLRVGDRVRCLRAVDGNRLVRGAVGTICEVVSSDLRGRGDRFAVHFDNNVNGHTSGPIEPGHGWHCNGEDLELFDPRSAGAKSIGEFFKKQEAMSCPSA